MSTTNPGPQGPDGKSPSTDGARTGPKIIPVDELRKGGTRFVRLLDRPTLEWIVGRAVAAATRVPLPPTLDAKARQAAVQAAAREEVRRALKQEQWLAPEEEAAKRKRNALEKTVVRLREELGSTVLRLRLLKTRPAELDLRSLSPEALDGLGQRVREVVVGLAATGELRAPASRPGEDALRARIDAVVGQSIAAERERLVVEVTRARAERVKALEDRVDSLTAELKRAEEQLAQPDLLQATSSPFTVPPKGLDHADPFFMWRWRLLNWVFLENCELQGRNLDQDLQDPAPADLLAPVPAWLERGLAGTPSAVEESTTSEAPTTTPEATDRRAWLREQLEPEAAPITEPTGAPARAWLDETTSGSSLTPVESKKETPESRDDDGKAARRTWLYEALSTSVSTIPEEGA